MFLKFDALSAFYRDEIWLKDIKSYDSLTTLYMQENITLELVKHRQT